VHSGSENGKRATQIANQSKSIRSEWWAERSALDERLKILLENIEFCWLGAFKVSSLNAFLASSLRFP
jgi:separase